MRAIARSGPPAPTGALHTPGGAGRDAPPANTGALAYWSLHDIATKFDIFDVYDIPRPNSADKEDDTVVSSRSSDCEELSARSSPLSARLTPFVCWLSTNTKETLRACRTTPRSPLSNESGALRLPSPCAPASTSSPLPVYLPVS
jgi:hypothetical protein